MTKQGNEIDTSPGRNYFGTAKVIAIESRCLGWSRCQRRSKMALPDISWLKCSPISTWWLIPRIVSGLVHPSYKWTNPTCPIYNQGGLTHFDWNLAGGLVAINFMFPLILGCDDHPNWRTHIFQRGGEKPPTRNVHQSLDLSTRCFSFLVAGILGTLIYPQDAQQTIHIQKKVLINVVKPTLETPSPIEGLWRWV